MPPILRSIVAQFRGGGRCTGARRNFSSSIDPKRAGERVVADTESVIVAKVHPPFLRAVVAKLKNPGLVQCALYGYGTYTGWRMIEMYVYKRAVYEPFQKRMAEEAIRRYIESKTAN